MENAPSQLLTNAAPAGRLSDHADEHWMGTPPISILLIEDDDLDAELLSRRLNSSTDHTFRIQRETGLIDGLSALMYGDFDCVVLDLSLPDASGLSGCDSILSHAASIPLVILTGIDDEGIAVEAVMRGAQDFLTKGDTTSSNLERAIRLAVARDDSKRHDLHGIITGKIPLQPERTTGQSVPSVDASSVALKLAAEVLDALDPVMSVPSLNRS